MAAPAPKRAYRKRAPKLDSTAARPVPGTAAANAAAAAASRAERCNNWEDIEAEVTQTPIRGVELPTTDPTVSADQPALVPGADQPAHATGAAELVLIADSRERRGAIPFLPAIIAANNSQYASHAANAGGGRIEFRNATIHAGDYAFARGRTTVAVAERKTWADLSATISDGRAAGQHENMLRLRASGVLVFYIIEGTAYYSPTTTIGRKPFSTLAKRLRRDMIRGIPYVQTKNEEATAQFLVDFARDLLAVLKGGCCDEAPAGASLNLPVPWNEPPDDVQAVPAPHVRSAPHVEQASFQEKLMQLCAEYPGEPIAQHITGILSPNIVVDHAGGRETLPADVARRNVVSAATLTAVLWQAIPGIAAAAYPAFMQEFTFSEFFNTPYEQLLQRVASMTRASGTKLGTSAAARICEITYSGGDLFRHAPARLLRIKFLSAIPGLTPESAAAILDCVSIADLAAGRFIDKELAAVKIGKRNLGPAAVNKLRSLLAPADQQRTGRECTVSPQRLEGAF